MNLFIKSKKAITFVVLVLFVLFLYSSISLFPTYGKQTSPNDQKSEINLNTHTSPSVQGMISKEHNHPNNKRKLKIWPVLLVGATALVVVALLFHKKKSNHDSNNNEGTITTTGWGSYGGGEGQFRFPMGVALDNSGNVYISDYDNTRIQKFTKNGEYISSFGPPMYSYSDFKPSSSIIYNQTLFVCDGGGNSRIVLFNLDGQLIDKWQIVSVGNGIGTNSIPSAITADSSGNIYVTEWFYQKIFKFDSHGLLLKSWGNGQGCELDQFNFPEGVLVINNEVFVADKFNNRIMVFDSNGNYLRHWNTHDNYQPYDMAVDGNKNLLIISKKISTEDSYKIIWSGISKYNSQGLFMGNSPGSLNSLSAIAINHQKHKIYLTDYEFHRVIVMDEF